MAEEYQIHVETIEPDDFAPSMVNSFSRVLSVLAQRGYIRARGRAPFVLTFENSLRSDIGSEGRAAMNAIQRLLEGRSEVAEAFVVLCTPTEPRGFAYWGAGGDIAAAGAATDTPVHTALETFLRELSAARTPDDPQARDSGLALLEPITQMEHAAIERVLTIIWQAAANDRLNEAQERMVLSVASMIEQERRETQLGETERYGPVAVVRRALRIFMSGDDVVKNALAWSQVIEILYEIGWRVTAKHLGG